MVADLSRDGLSVVFELRDFLESAAAALLCRNPPPAPEALEAYAMDTAPARPMVETQAGRGNQCSETAAADVEHRSVSRAPQGAANEEAAAYRRDHETRKADAEDGSCTVGSQSRVPPGAEKGAKAPMDAAPDDDAPLTAEQRLESQKLLRALVHKRQRPEYQAMLELRRTLPACAFMREILDAIYAHQVVVISGATGCGKTTQVSSMQER